MKGKPLTNLLIGAAIGGAVGVLLAPDKGSKTRKQIKDKFDKTMVKADNKIQDIKAIASDKADMLLEKKDKIMEKVQKVAEKLEKEKAKLDKRSQKEEMNAAALRMR